MASSPAENMVIGWVSGGNARSTLNTYSGTPARLRRSAASSSTCSRVGMSPVNSSQMCPSTLGISPSGTLGRASRVSGIV